MIAESVKIYTPGKCVIVNYDGCHYVGKILKTEDVDIKIMCMKNTGANVFSWPKKKDVCWYGHDQILAVIPEPSKIGQGYRIELSVWQDFF